MEFRTLRKEELEQWFDHCTYVFNGGTFSESFKRYFMNHYYNDPWRELDSIFVAVEEGVIASTVRVFVRRILFEGEELMMGGIGEVSSKPEHRGKGHIATLIGMAINYMKEQGYQVSMLAGNPAIYTRFGWRPITQSYSVGIYSKSNEVHYELQPMDYTKDVHGMKEIYHEYCGNFNGPIERDSDFYWEKWFATECKNTYVIRDHAGVMQGYIVYELKDEKVFVKEFATLSLETDFFDKAVSSLVGLLGLEQMEVDYPSIIHSETPIKETHFGDSWMIQLLAPIHGMDTTEALIERMQGDAGSGPWSRFYFWGTDGF